MNSSVIGKGTHYLDVEMLGRVSKAGGTSCSDVIVQMMTYYLLPITYYRIIVLSMIAYLMVLFVLFLINIMSGKIIYHYMYVYNV